MAIARAKVTAGGVSGSCSSSSSRNRHNVGNGLGVRGWDVVVHSNEIAEHLPCAGALELFVHVVVLGHARVMVGTRTGLALLHFRRMPRCPETVVDCFAGHALPRCVQVVHSIQQRQLAGVFLSQVASHDALCVEVLHILDDPGIQRLRVTHVRQHEEDSDVTQKRRVDELSDYPKKEVSHGLYSSVTHQGTAELEEAAGHPSLGVLLVHKKVEQGFPGMSGSFISQSSTA